jgi:hypothetical protein
MIAVRRRSEEAHGSKCGEAELQCVPTGRFLVRHVARLVTQSFETAARQPG